MQLYNYKTHYHNLLNEFKILKIVDFDYNVFLHSLLTCSAVAIMQSIVEEHIIENQGFSSSKIVFSKSTYHLKVNITLLFLHNSKTRILVN